MCLIEILTIAFALLIVTCPMSYCTADQPDKCLQVLDIDCASEYMPEGDETSCGSDMKVYDNWCFFAQQKCRRDPDLTVFHPGQCIYSTVATLDHTTDSQSLSTKDFTVASNPIFMSTTTVAATTSDIIYKVFCANKDQLGCPSGLDPYCGTDNTFYNNECEFAKAQCENESLKPQDLNICKTASRFKRSLRFV